MLKAALMAKVMLLLVGVLATYPVCAGERQNVFHAVMDKPLVSMFARGVYWPWEMTKPAAAAAGMEKWAFVDQMMRRLAQDYSCNVVWFVNGPDDPKQTAELADKYGMKVLFGADFFGFYAHGGVNPQKIAQKADESVARLKDLPGFIGYVLKDEPRSHEAPFMESLRQLMVERDPVHPSIVVAMTGDTEAYVKNTGFPVICTDIYHFGGNKSPNIPSSRKSSMQCYRGAVESLCRMTGKHGKVAWSMPQVFTEVWGLSWLDENGNVVIEPGSYHHWRMPMVGEMQWQTWEAIRGGAKGVVFFALMFSREKQWSLGEPVEAKISEKMAKNKAEGLPVLTERLHTGMQNGLLRHDGGDTPHARAMGEDFKMLAKCESVIASWASTNIDSVYAEKPGHAGNFHAHRKGYYCVVVNDDTEKEQTITLTCTPNVKGLKDLLTEQPIALVSPQIEVDGVKNAEVTIPAGAGTILEVSFHNSPIGIFDENFGNARKNVRLENADVVTVNEGFRMGAYPAVRRGADSTKESLIVIDDLEGKLKRFSASPNGIRRVYLAVDASVSKSESLVVQFVNAEGKAGWNKTEAYELPKLVPDGTKEIRLRLEDSALVKRIRLFAVEEPIEQME